MDGLRKATAATTTAIMTNALRKNTAAMLPALIVSADGHNHTDLAATEVVQNTVPSVHTSFAVFHAFCPSKRPCPVTDNHDVINLLDSDSSSEGAARSSITNNGGQRGNTERQIGAALRGNFNGPQPGSDAVASPSPPANHNVGVASASPPVHHNAAVANAGGQGRITADQIVAALRGIFNGHQPTDDQIAATLRGIFNGHHANAGRQGRITDDQIVAELRGIFSGPQPTDDPIAAALWEICNGPLPGLVAVASASPANGNAGVANAGGQAGYTEGQVRATIPTRSLRTLVADLQPHYRILTRVDPPPGADNYGGAQSSGATGGVSIDPAAGAFIPVLASASLTSNNSAVPFADAAPTYAPYAAAAIPPPRAQNLVSPSVAENPTNSGIRRRRNRGTRTNRRARNDWDAWYAAVDAAKIEEIRNYQAPMLRNARLHLQVPYDLEKIRVFLRDVMLLNPTNLNKIMRHIRSMYNGNGLSHRSWAVALLGGQSIRTLEYDFNLIANMADHASKVLGNSSHGWLTHSVRYLHRYQVYYNMMLTDRRQFDTIRDWRAHFGLPCLP